MAEIAGRDDQARARSRSRRWTCARGPGEIGHLRQQPADIDRIGRGQPVRARPAPDRRRPPSPGAGNRRNRRPPPAPGPARPSRSSCCSWKGETRPFGIEDQRADRRPPLGRAADRAAGIARGRDEDGQRSAVAEPVEAGHQEARAEILERAGRAVEQLERAQARPRGIGRDERRRKIERLARRSPADRRQRDRRRRRARRSARRTRRAAPPHRAQPDRRRIGSAGTYSPPSGAAPLRIASLSADRRRPAARADELHAARRAVAPALAAVTPRQATGAR